MQLVNYKPSTSALVTNVSSYQSYLAAWRETASRFKELEQHGAVDVPIDAADTLTITTIKTFLQWTRTYTPEQWRAGVQLPVKTIHEVCGKNRSPVNDARRACLIVVKPGNRRRGEVDTYSLSEPHVLGLAKCLAGHAALIAANAAIELEQTVARIIHEDTIHRALSPGLYANGDDPLQIE